MSVDELDYDELMKAPDPGDYFLPFGKYAGRTLVEVAETDEGLLYLDWFAGAVDGGAGDAVRAFLDDDVMQDELIRLTEAGDG